MKTIVSLEKSGKFEELTKRLTHVIQSGQYSEGAQLRELSNRISFMYGQHTVLCSNAGAALYSLARNFRSTNVAVPNNTFYATGAMFEEAGHQVFAVDCRPDCPSMSYESLVSLWERVPFKIVVLTHVGGMQAKDYGRIASFCNERKIILLEDASHCFGLESQNNGPGTLGLATVFSFYATKSVPFGEGGAVISKEESLIKSIGQFINYGKHFDGEKMNYTRGFNLRMDEWTAAVGNVQLSRLPEIHSARRRDAERLKALFPPLFDRPTTWYKYIVAPMSGYRTAGKVYAEYDLLHRSMAGRIHLPVSFFNSLNWSKNHQCLPIGEGLYDGLSDQEIHQLLKV